MKVIMKVIKFFGRHKTFTSIIIFAFIAMVTCISLSPYVAIRFPTSDIGGACGFIVFDKKQMNAVDRIEIQTVNKMMYAVKGVSDRHLLQHTQSVCLRHIPEIASEGGWYPNI